MWRIALCCNAYLPAAEKGLSFVQKRQVFPKLPCSPVNLLANCCTASSTGAIGYVVAHDTPEQLVSTPTSWTSFKNTNGSRFLVHGGKENLRIDLVGLRCGEDQVRRINGSAVHVRDRTLQETTIRGKQTLNLSLTQRWRHEVLVAEAHRVDGGIGNRAHPRALNAIGSRSRSAPAKT